LEDISTLALSLILFFLILFSAYFSSSETGIMTVNRYRLRHMAKSKHRGAKRVLDLLKRPDRLIGVILIGNNFVNILAASLATILCVRLWGNYGLLIANLGLTFIILIFAELTPKTLAALYPEKVAFPSSILLKPLLWLLFPLVILVNAIANGLLRMVGIKNSEGLNDALSADELRSVVNEAGPVISTGHKKMLISILDLEHVTVEDIMIPRNDIEGIDLTDEWEDILRQITHSPVSRLVVYDDEIDKLLGILHIKETISFINKGEFTADDLRGLLRPVYYIPEGTPLNVQLLKFQRKKQRVGIVVDEYGDVQGLATLEDILEEIVGEFTTDLVLPDMEIRPDGHGAYFVEGGANIRELNKAMHWGFNTDGPKTLSGLITEHLEDIPSPGTSIMLSQHPVEIIQVKDNMVKLAKVHPRLKTRLSHDN
jgi:Mg2+/Co2+ transporter CorB|tara:strand:- start:301 stop:1581 length:1281 start_codon:yes stop_codon:yes gene_type:complete